MWRGAIKLNQFVTKADTIKSFVCFRKFIDFLEANVQKDNGSRSYFYKFVLEKIRSFPQLSNYVPITEIEKYGEILDLVGAIVFPLIDDEEDALIGLTNAASPEAFYATNAFSRLFKPGSDMQNHLPWEDENSLKAIHKEFQYSLALQKIYGYALPNRKEIIHSFFDTNTGLYKYYRLNFNTRFVDIAIKPTTERISNQLVNSCLMCSNPLEKIEEVISLEHYTASGFSILSLTDVTAQQAAEQIGKLLGGINQENMDSIFLHVNQLLQTIIGSNKYRFGIMPFFTVNKRTALPYDNFLNSILITTSVQAGISKTVFSRYMNHYLKNPVWITYQSSSLNNNLPVPVQKALYKAGIHYYTLTPLFFNDQPVGILEIAGGNDITPLNDLQASQLKPAMPYLSEMMQRLIENFNVSIDAIVKEKFTNIQPSVQWKFNEVAWHYFRNNSIEHKNTSLEKILFKDVYPLYGAVDIRNSTIERNNALRNDLAYQLTDLIFLLTSLSEAGYGEQCGIYKEDAVQWLNKMQGYVSVEEEMELNQYLYNKVHPFILSIDLSESSLDETINNYFQSINELTGSAFNKRRQLENAMQKLNGVIGQYFDLFNAELQIHYPCYFEKFRTDGVEYDIYIGQSITPSKPFTTELLERLRLWQIRSMAAIAKLTHNMQSQLEYYLETTQLIFVNSRTIDISFRNDERRFDVEGAYNIRYQVVKKRIDKVHIRNTDERLTQPGKIAIVYFNEQDVISYIEGINQLQEEQILSDDFEMLELEDLQGVAGLKALRVGVFVG